MKKTEGCGPIRDDFTLTEKIAHQKLILTYKKTLKWLLLTEIFNFLR